MAKYQESFALSRQYSSRIQADKTLDGKIRLSTALKTGSEQRYDEALQYVQEAADIFRDTSSRHLPEVEATLEELQGLRISKDWGELQGLGISRD